MESFYLMLHPRPAYVIGVGRYREKVNFMAASWVMPVAEEPPKVAVAVDVENYSHELIEKYKEFTVNVLSIDNLKELYFFGSTSGREINKAEKLGLKVIKGEKVNAPILDIAIGVLECKVVDKHCSEDTTLFIGEVVNAMAKKEYFDSRRGWNLRKVSIPLHNWGRGFYSIGKFYMPSSIS